jgi:HlyD family secretion protein
MKLYHNPSHAGWLFLALLAGCNGQQGENAEKAESHPSYVEVGVTTVERGDVAETLDLVGNFLPRRRTIIVTEVDGVITSIPCSKELFEVEVGGRHYSEQLGLNMGQKILKGDVLLEIDRRDYELALAAAEAAKESVEKELAALMSWKRAEEIVGLQASRDEKYAQLGLARSEWQRVESLRGKKVVTESELEQYRAEQSIAQAAFDRAEADLMIAKNGPTAPQINLAKAKIAQAEAEVNVRKDSLARTTIRAPYDAVITDRFVEVGDRVTALPRVEIMEIMDLSMVVVQAGIPERYIHKVQVRDHVCVKAEGVTEPVPGVVTHINSKVDPDSRTYRVRVAVDNRDDRFKAGQFVRVGFTLESSVGNLNVPTRAVTYSGGQPQVFVYANEKVALRNVTLGLADGRSVEILEGLAEREQIVIDDPAILSDGMAVRPKLTERSKQTEEVAWIPEDGR